MLILRAAFISNAISQNLLSVLAFREEAFLELPAGQRTLDQFSVWILLSGANINMGQDNDLEVVLYVL